VSAGRPGRHGRSVVGASSPRRGPGRRPADTRWERWNASPTAWLARDLRPLRMPPWRSTVRMTTLSAQLRGGPRWALLVRGCAMPGYPTDHAGLEILPFDECLRLLASVPVGRVGFIADGELVMLPVNHVVDGHDVAFRTARGSKLPAAEGQNLATFRGRLLRRADPVWVERCGDRTRGGGRCRGRRPAAGPPWPAPLGHRRTASVLDSDPAHLGQRTADTGSHIARRPARRAVCAGHPYARAGRW